MVRSLSLFATFFLLTFALHAPAADVLFEGYSKITSGGVHVGYVVTRYEFDAKSKQFRGIYFLKTGALGSDVTESVKSAADQDLNPISYEYTSIVGKTVKTIDAKFRKGRMTAVVSEGGKDKTIQRDLPKGAFLSNFLVYLMLKSKTGLQSDSKYEYSAVAEEDAEVLKGEALVGKEEKYNNFRAFKILNRFKDMKFISYVTDRGEVLGTSSPSNGIATELMARPGDAVGTFGTNATILKKLFGDVPLGTNNAVSKAAQAEAFKEEPTKQQGIPPGQGILIKQNPEPTAKEATPTKESAPAKKSEGP